MLTPAEIRDQIRIVPTSDADRAALPKRPGEARTINAIAAADRELPSPIEATPEQIAEWLAEPE